tara:strand:- start:46985 stop:47689 length:705 start_codon:yes stop_codon:yes gene_type:complete
MFTVLKPVYQELEFGGAEEAAYRRNSAAVINSITQEKRLYDCLIDIAKESDKSKRTIQYQLTQGINTFNYDELIKLIYKFENNKVQNLFPHLIFSNIKTRETTFKGNKLNKTLSFDVTGHRHQLRIFHDSILCTDFDSEFPLFTEKANFSINETFKIFIPKRDFQKLEEKVKFLSKLLSKTKINIDYNKSNYSSLFNSFSKNCNIFLNIKGIECEFDYLIKELTEDYLIDFIKS